MMNKKIFSFLVVLLFFLSGMAQENSGKENEIKNKGKFFIYWGWNRGYYTNSNIHFKGDHYDFTLYAVKATDRQTPFSWYDYFNPERITIPQTNFRVGYFLKENYTISLGLDHMKYVMVQNQDVKIDGDIHVGNSEYDGTYNNDNIKLVDRFLTYEHTDGLNYVNIQFYRFDDLGKWFNLNLKNFQINLTEGVGMGVLLPKTNAKLLNKGRRDDFHLSGFGLFVGAGLNLTFFKYFFIQSDLKGGYINMPDIRTTMSESDKSSQSFFFGQYNILIGGRFGF